MPQKIKYIGLFISVALLLGSCKEKPETQEEYIQRALREKISNFKITKREKCAESILDKATRISDSILLKEALKLDSLQEKLPIVPPKPAFIEPKPLKDSLPIRPFLKK
ncbi:MAG TPA: hypothetical protein ENK85_00735 [Saprospiraceae bacterium]|nr:hypothetical protein [Saprospiraceae bacterium]